MSDLKQLYFKARNGQASDVSSYVEAVNRATDNPADYILNLEYIISSSTGLSTLKPFIEKHGLPIAVCVNTIQLLEKCVEKCNALKKDASLYKEAFDYLTAYKEKYHGAFDMFDYYSEADVSRYIKTYYSSTNGQQNRKLCAGMLKNYGEAALPDLIITANESGINASDKLSAVINESSYAEDPLFCEWVMYACNGTSVHPDLKANTLSAIVEDCRERNSAVYRESVIMNIPDASYTYTDEEIDSINKLIKFKEFVLTGMDESKIDSIMEAQREIYDLYEEMDGLITEVDADIIQFLPEDNTRDKKISAVPDYIKKNHDISTYGEEEPKENPEEKEKTLDDYRRASAKEEPGKEDDGEIPPYDGPTSSGEVKPEEPIKGTEPGKNPVVDDGEKEKQAIKNYYYYNYINSLNKSSRDDHSVHTKDDHSAHDSYNSKSDDKKEDEFHAVESVEAKKTTSEELVPLLILLRHYGKEDQELMKKYEDNPDFKRSVKLGGAIKFVSGGDNYTHAVVSFDEQCKELYSFESMGIVEDSLDSPFWDFTTSVYIGVVFMTKEEKESIRKMCKDYAENKNTTAYAYSDLISLLIGRKMPKQERRFLCSSFSAFLLGSVNAKNLHKDYSKIRPDDITILPRAFYVGNYKNADDIRKHASMIHDKVEAIKKSHKEELEEYNNDLPKIILEDKMMKKRFLDKILDSIMGSKLNSRMKDQ